MSQSLRSFGGMAKQSPGLFLCRSPRLLAEARSHSWFESRIRQKETGTPTDFSLKCVPIVEKFFHLPIRIRSKRKISAKTKKY